MIFNKKTKLLIFFPIILLTGCKYFTYTSLNSICEITPEFCEDLHVIGDCRYQRTTVIRSLHYDKNEPSELNKQILLTELDEYESCLELTLFLQFTRNKQRKKYRIENYLKTQSLIKEHVAESKNTQDPMLAYYLWTRHNDMQAREVFLTAATKKQIKDPRLLIKLATVYTKDNPQEALKQFYNAMHVSQSLKRFSSSNFAMIMTILYQHKKFEDAYVWALIAIKEDEEDEYPINLDIILRKGLPSGVNLITNEGQLQEKADTYYKQLKKGQFKAEAPLLI